MDKQALDEKIIEAAKAIFSYAYARTPDRYEAEELSQNIILEIYRSSANIRDEKAFYGFMWSVAANVYKQWYRRRIRESRGIHLPESQSMDISLEENSDVYLLRRELMLLSEQYRRATVLYYIENQSCAEISKRLQISESMVKYLLFKSRQKIKEGFQMERNYGEQSFNPKKMNLLYWGNGYNRYYNLGKSMINQNILYACYNDKLTAEQISVEIGVALPYMEENLKELCEFALLQKDGKRYYTNIPIFTKEFTREVDRKTEELRCRIAEIIKRAIEEKKAEIRSLKISGSNMNQNTFRWQMAVILLYRAVIEKLQKRVNITYPVDKFGEESFVWLSESFEEETWQSQFGFGISNMKNEEGDYLQFIDFPVNGEMVHHYCFNRQNVTNVFLDIAKGNTEDFSENDLACAADMVRKGYVCSDNGKLTLNVPVFVRRDFDELLGMLDDYAEQIVEEAQGVMGTVTQILKDHLPTHLRKMAGDLSYLRLFEDVFSAPVRILVEQSYLFPHTSNECLPTTYVILK